MTNSIENVNKVSCRSSLKVIKNSGKIDALLKRRSIPISFGLFLLFTITLCASANATAEDGVCGSIQIRYNLENVTSFRNCRIMEGSVKIFSLHDYENLSFPELVEITDYIILYNVIGLKSLARIFPNLQVIRGNNLYENYALVIYRMPDLTEVGLKSLTAIVRGGVRIQNNPALCFADTINWVYIANGTQPEDHIIGSNKNGKECPVCRTVFEQDTNKSYCWNSHIPQRICPDHCGQRSCDDQGHCCDETCLGSCNSNNTKLCSVCRNLSVGPLNSRQCVDTCPDGLFMYKQWRCITKEECWNISQPLTLQNTRTNLYIPYDGKCHRMCPENHIAEEDNGRRVCKSCNGECKKECPGGTIEDLSSAQLFRKCAIITGTLIIKIRQRDQSIIKELEQSLSDVEEIGGTLKIVGSYPLISLNFFRKLKVIRGKNARDHYALYVVNNQNLQSLFEQDVTIEEGKILFHFNSKLCYEKIWAIKKNVIDLRETYVLAIEDVAIDSNGNKAACNVEKLMTRVSTVMHFGAIIDVETMHFDDKRVLLGYDLYYKEAPHTNVSIFEGRSVCEDNGWRVEDVTVFDRRAQIVQIILTKLKPYTQYAYYVKTFTIAWEPFGGQSDINYFRTSPSQPGPVQNLEIVAHDSSSIVIKWEPPEKPNGRLTIYIVKAALIHDDPELLNQRNYCEEPITTLCEQYNNITKITESVPNPNPTDGERYSSVVSKNKIAQAALDNVNFENRLQNFIYVKRTFVNGSRIRRNTESTTYSDQLETNERMLKVVMANNNQTNGSTFTFKFDKLRHFSMYSISVMACRDLVDPLLRDDTYCSYPVVINQRTSKIDVADSVRMLNYRNVKDGDNKTTKFQLFWEEPTNPNGLILSYAVLLKRIDWANVRPTELCFTQKHYSSSNGQITLPQLSNGKYSISVKATSLAGDGYPSDPLFVSVMGEGSQILMNEIFSSSCPERNVGCHFFVLLLIFIYFNSF